jgi:hypothetical protein
MDIGSILSRAWRITWRWKILWLLGFLAALGQSTGGVNWSYQFSSGDFQNGRWPNIDIAPIAGGLILGLVCLGLLVAIALWVISVIARGGLIGGVAQVEEQGATTLGSAWAAGQRRFWTLVGIGFLTALPIILVVVAMVTGVVLIAGGSAAFQSARGEASVAPVMTGLLACICPSVCLLVILAAVLGQIRIFAERAAILEDLGWLDAFGRGWRVLRDNLGSTILLWIVFLVLGLIVGFVALALMAPIMLPVVALFRTGMNNAGSNALLLTTLCGFGLIGIIVSAIVGAVINTFTSATWTVAYREMTAPPAPLVRSSEPIVEG